MFMSGGCFNGLGIWGVGMRGEQGEGRIGVVLWWFDLCDFGVSGFVGFFVFYLGCVHQLSCTEILLHCIKQISHCLT